MINIFAICTAMINIKFPGMPFQGFPHAMIKVITIPKCRCAMIRIFTTQKYAMIKVNNTPNQRCAMIKVKTTPNQRCAFIRVIMQVQVFHVQAGVCTQPTGFNGHDDHGQDD